MRVVEYKNIKIGNEGLEFLILCLLYLGRARA